jgi:hypothetical protein
MTTQAERTLEDRVATLERTMQELREELATLRLTLRVAAGAAAIGRLRRVVSVLVGHARPPVVVRRLLHALLHERRGGCFCNDDYDHRCWSGERARRDSNPQPSDP